MEILKDNIILSCSAVIIILTFLVRIPVMCRPKRLTYQYSARTRYENQDHTYIFIIQMMKNGYYRCYIERAPFLFGKRFSRYTIDYGYDKKIEKAFILTTAKIHSITDAKELCTEWGNSNQYVIDSHRLNC